MNKTKMKKMIVGCEPSGCYWLIKGSKDHIVACERWKVLSSYLLSGVYAEIREAPVCRDQVMKQHVRLSNQIQGWLQSDMA